MAAQTPDEYVAEGFGGVQFPFLHSPVEEGGRFMTGAFSLGKGTPRARLTPIDLDNNKAPGR